ncbi:15051_t:CDS:2, partial [Funneliformis caledonium]
MFLQKVIQKINSFLSLLLPIEWFAWFTYFVILPMTSLFGWLALPFVTLAFIVANVFGVVQLLLRAMTNNFKQTPTDGTSGDDNINEMFVSTREALMTILPQASEEDIGKYEKQISKVDILDPVLMIVPNQNWINQHTYVVYQQVMDAFATVNLPQNRRRDENSRSIFHFPNLNDLYTVRDAVCRLHPNAFFDPNAQPQQEPIGSAWILTNVAVRKSDFAEDN